MKISVLYGCDNNYAPYTGVSMTSLFENNKDVENITIYLAAMDFTPENLELFQSVATQYGRDISILDTNAALSRMKAYKCGTWNGSIATWLRFFVLEQIPQDVDRLIWIDSDTVVDCGIEELGRIDLGDSEVSAVCDCISYRERFRLGLGLNNPYFNAGVIVFNLEMWRKNDTLNLMMKHLEKNISKYTVNDQDLMNDYFKGRIVKLPARFNVQCFLKAYDVEDYFSFYPWIYNAFYTPDEIRNALERPVITHFFRFLGDYPWTRGDNLHPAKDLYEKWKNFSVWKDDLGASPKKSLAFKVEKLLFKVLPRRVFLRIFVLYTNRKMPKHPVL